MIDIHSHILPKLDDGSKSIEESIVMLNMLSDQGVTSVAATPHFYANHITVEEFLNKRQFSYELLLPHLDSHLPTVVLGAEVKYYEGISRLEGLQNLSIGNTKLLLLEMSMRKWTEYTVRELCELSTSGEFTIVLAHIERYIKFQNRELIENLRNSGILIQANAEFFTSFGSRRKAMNMLESNLIQFLGSDCHNISARPPKIGEAADYIRRKAGENFFSDMNRFAHSYFDV